MNISCVQIKTFHVLKSRHFLCSNQDISCVPIRTSLVLQSWHPVCSNQDTFCVPIKTCGVLQSRHLLCSNQDISCAPIRTNPGSQPRRVLVPRHDNFSFPNKNIFPKFQTPLLAEFYSASRDSFQLELDPHKSQNVRRNSPKSGKILFLKNKCV